MGRYQNQALRQLRDQQVRFAPREKRLQQVERAEQLLGEIKDDKAYPYQYIFFRVTDYRPDEYAKLVLPGRAVRHDLRLLVEDLSDSADLAVEAVGEPVLTVEEISGRFNISAKTVMRWRSRGLVGRRFVMDGRKRIGFLKSSVESFVAENRERVERSSRFSQLSEDEKEEIIRRARRMATVCRTCLAEISRRVARKLGRSPETIRYTIKNYDRENPSRAVFPGTTGPLGEKEKQAIYRLHRRGTPAEALAGRYGRTKTSIYRIINEVRARRILEQKLEYMAHSSFDEPGADELIVGPMPEGAEKARRMQAPKDLPPYLASLYEVPLLSKEQEVHLFRKLNYLKHKAAKLRAGLVSARASSRVLDKIEELQEGALAIKNQIVRANLRLVVSIAKRHVGSSNSFFELVSDGNMSLIRAAEKFDFSRGNKFSTYASWAIMKNFARSIPEENLRRDRFVTGQESLFEAAADRRSDQYEVESALKRVQSAVGQILGRLDERERSIIVSRFGLEQGSEPLTLEEVGNQLGVTKERVRQLEARALGKLRRFASEEKVELPEL